MLRVFVEYFLEDELHKLLSEDSNLDNDGRAHSSSHASRSRTHAKDNNAFYYDKTKFLFHLLHFIKQHILLSKNQLLIKTINYVINEVTAYYDSVDVDSPSDINCNNACIKPSKALSNLQELKAENKQLKQLYEVISKNMTLKFNKQFNLEINHNKISSINSMNRLTLNEVKQLVFPNACHSTNTNNPLLAEHSLLSPTSHNLTPHIQTQLNQIDKETFNIFAFENAVGSANTLTYIALYAFSTFALYTIIKYPNFELFLKHITAGYNRSNPYHNDLHAADITQGVILILRKTSFAALAKLSIYDIASLFIASVVHDYKHPGVTNSFLMNTESAIAYRYNDSNILESYHVAQAFKLIKSNPALDIFSDVSRDNKLNMRERIIRCVLATEMVHHGNMLKTFKECIEKNSIVRGNNVAKVFDGVGEKELRETQQSFMNVVVHFCDVSNPTREFAVYEQWAHKVMEEFYLQGDKETELGLQISFLCDRNSVSIEQGQIGFISGVVSPFVDLVVNVFPELEFMKVNVEKNREEFERRKKEKEKEV